MSHGGLRLRRALLPDRHRRIAAGASVVVAARNAEKAEAALAELGRLHVHAGKVAFPDIPRF